MLPTGIVLEGPLVGVCGRVEDTPTGCITRTSQDYDKFCQDKRHANHQN